MKLKKARKQAKGVEIRIEFETEKAADRCAMKWGQDIRDGGVENGIDITIYRAGTTLVLCSNSKGAKRFLENM